MKYKKELHSFLYFGLRDLQHASVLKASGARCPRAFVHKEEWSMISMSKTQRRNNIQGFLFIAPAMIGFLAFMVYPIIASVFISFMDWNIISKPQWTGISNYVTLFNDKTFLISMMNTFKWIIVYIPLSITLSFILALAAELPLRGIQALRTIFYLPVVSPLLVVALLFVWLYNPEFGLINYALSFVGIPQIGWLTNPNIAIFSIALMTTWKMAGYNMIIFLAGLNGIPHHLYEAADLDGIKPMQKIWYIKLPLITPAIYYVMIMSIIYAFQVFGEIYVMTKGGPGYSTYTMAFYLYQNAYNFGKMGYGSAMSFVMTLVILAVTIIQSFVLGRKVQYEM
jgi:multiple sugar transport system permease protein